MPQPSPGLTDALDRFRDVVVSDDVERADALDRADDAWLADLAAAVDPLFPEINRILDLLDAHPGPLVGGLDELESDLHSLAQAAMEARMTLDAR